MGTKIKTKPNQTKPINLTQGIQFGKVKKELNSGKNGILELKKIRLRVVLWFSYVFNFSPKHSITFTA